MIKNMLAYNLLLHRWGILMNRYSLKRLNPRSGQGLVEYTLVIGLVAVALIVVLTVVGELIRDNYLGNFQKVSDAVLPSTSSAPPSGG